jgi:hypothetical protein
MLLHPVRDVLAPGSFADAPQRAWIRRSFSMVLSRPLSSSFRTILNFSLASLVRWSAAPLKILD